MLNSLNSASAQTVAAILPPTVATTHSTVAASPPSANPPAAVADYYITLTLPLSIATSPHIVVATVTPPLTVVTTPRTVAATVTPPLTIATTHRTVTASPPSTTHTVAADDTISYDSKNVLLVMATGLLDESPI